MLLFFIYLFVLGFLLRKYRFFRTENFRGFGIYLVLLIKMGLAILLYQNPLESFKDSQIYLNDSRVLSNLFWQSPSDFFSVFFHLSDAQNLDLKFMQNTNYWSHDTAGFLSEKRNVIRINALFQLLSFQNPYVVFLWNAVVSILGLNLFYSALRRICNDPNDLLFLLIFLLPSTLLWTSNIMKESYMLLGLGLLFYGILNSGSIKKRLLYLTSGLLLILLFRQFIALGFALGLLIYIALSLPTFKSRLIGLFALGTIGAFLTVALLHEITASISRKQRDFIELATGGIVLKDGDLYCRIESPEQGHLEIIQGKDKNVYAKILKKIVANAYYEHSKAKTLFLEPSDKLWYVWVYQKPSGSRIDVTPIDNDPIQLLKNIPEALINTFLRPWPKDPPQSITKWYFILENYLLWGLLIIGWTKSKSSLYKNVLVIFAASCLIIGLFIGWTTPVIGAIVRYKLPIVLSFIAMSWLLLHPIIILKKS